MKYRLMKIVINIVHAWIDFYTQDYTHMNWFFDKFSKKKKVFENARDFIYFIYRFSYNIFQMTLRKTFDQFSDVRSSMSRDGSKDPGKFL